MPRLIVLARNSSVRQINIAGAVTTIGRADTNKVCIPSDRVSRRHATIEWTGDRFMLTDLGSRNGTYLNNEKVKACRLANGDAIVIGDCQLRFLYSSTELAQSDALRLLTVPDDPIDIDVLAVRRPIVESRPLVR
jgi:pSer/pThr/pTyr-binding forkhead associated (FHA) protein